MHRILRTRLASFRLLARVFVIGSTARSLGIARGCRTYKTTTTHRVNKGYEIDPLSPQIFKSPKRFERDSDIARTVFWSC